MFACPPKVASSWPLVDDTMPSLSIGTSTIELPEPAGGSVAVWSLEQYAGGLFLPVRDGTADRSSYGGGRYALEVADADPDRLAVGSRVELVFRRLFTAGGVHNYFWKARVVS